MDRDRDIEGRARTARPRDGLGRPLPHGSAGVQRHPEGVIRSPEQTLTEAQQLLDSGRPFHAHEVFEDAWKSSRGSDAHLWKALAQLAVGLTHRLRGNPVGADRLLRRAAAGLEPHVADPPYGLGLRQLRKWALGSPARAMPALRPPGPALRVHEDGQPIEFSYEAILDYHGRSAPAGVAHALKVMQRAFPLLDPSGPLERREIVIATAFAGPGARDAFEAVTRAVTGDRYTVEPRLEAPERGPTMANFVFHLSYRGTTVRLQLRAGHVSEEFIDLARADDLSAAQADRLHELKLEMSRRLRSLDAAEVYEIVPG